MKPSLTDVLPLLNANCGDVLKVALLQEFFPTLPRINPMWLKAPTGEIEAAFAAHKLAQPAENKADRLLADIKADHVKVEEKRSPRPIDPQVDALVRENTTAKPIADMPDSIKFEDVGAASMTSASVARDTAVATITAEAAAEEFGYSYAGIMNRLKVANIEGVRVSGQGRTKHYPRDRVELVCGSKGKRVR